MAVISFIFGLVLSKKAGSVDFNLDIFVLIFLSSAVFHSL